MVGPARDVARLHKKRALLKRDQDILAAGFVKFTYYNVCGLDGAVKNDLKGENR
jgi:hypothetical protein